MAINRLKLPDLSVKIGKLNLKNPIIMASGTYGYADEYDNYVNLKNIGAIITKGITLNPRSGNPQPRIKEINNGIINSIGLENIGIFDFITQKLPILYKKNIRYIVNIAGFSIDEYIQLAKICEDYSIEAIELNVSCPNVKRGCLEFGQDEKLLYKLVSSVRQVFSGTLIVKIGSNLANPAKNVICIENAGADAISAINTVKAMYVSAKIVNKKIFKTVLKGGLSGPVIKHIALEFIHEIRNNTNLPIIGIGGISNIEDIIEFLAVGATAVQIGTANFTNPYIGEILIQELSDLLINHNVESFTKLLGENR